MTLEECKLDAIEFFKKWPFKRRLYHLIGVGSSPRYSIEFRNIEYCTKDIKLTATCLKFVFQKDKGEFQLCERDKEIKDLNRFLSNTDKWQKSLYGDTDIPIMTSFEFSNKLYNNENCYTKLERLLCENNLYGINEINQQIIV